MRRSTAGRLAWFPPSIPYRASPGGIPECRPGVTPEHCLIWPKYKTKKKSTAWGIFIFFSEMGTKSVCIENCSARHWDQTSFTNTHVTDSLALRDQGIPKKQVRA